ncbi:uncharacterized protein LOC131665667 [Phymastichus coffea]|uniref:uncharacterized protein LOC131665667 n=1 Tax=Phymastichus coffea TaxID=108790 RepID=UPI00273C9E76|nr:uncharacterized protein LOC131665667 [Phymastichus coffea]
MKKSPIMSLTNEIKEFYSANFEMYTNLLCDPQQLVSENAWVLIHSARSTTDIRGEVQDEFNQRFAAMQLNTMDKYYGDTPLSATSIVENCHYALFDSQWFRVKCIKCNYQTRIAEVYFIDRGDFDRYPFNYLFNLFDFFYLFPPRAVKISIKDLEDYADLPEVADILSELLVEQNVFIKIKNLSMPHDDIFTLESDVHIMKPNGTMLNVISVLLDRIHESNLNPNYIIRTSDIIHYQAFIPQYASISCAKENEIYVQLNSLSSCYFNKLINLAKELLNTVNDLKSIDTFDRAVTYIVKHPVCQQIYRVKIINIKNYDEAEVMCIDFGQTFCVKKKDLIILEDISKPLAWYPEQAVQINLYQISPEMFDTTMAMKLIDLVPESQQVLLKVIDNTKEIPVVTLFRTGEDGFMKCINSELLVNSIKNSSSNN